MSNSPSLGTLIVEDDPVALNAKLNSLRTEYAEVKKGYAAARSAGNEAEANRLSDLAAAMINEQIGIISKLRRTSSGPAKAGGKRAKKAPIDLTTVLSRILKPAPPT